MVYPRRTFVTTFLAAAAACRPVSAQQLKSLKIIAPANPGGGYDQLARAIQDALNAEKVASGVQVTNIIGGGGTIGLAQFVTSKERDPVLLVAGLGMVGAIITNKAAVSLDQVTPLARLQGEYQPLFVSASSPIKTLDDLLSKFKENPGSVSWGGFAPGSPDHILSGLVVKGAGGDVKKMNYSTGGEMLPLVMSGKVTVATGGLNEVAGQFKAGKLRAIGISSPDRLPGVDIPTFKEQGLDVTLVNWRGLMAPSTISASDKQVVEDAIRKMTESETWKKTLQQREWIGLYMPSTEFATFVKEEQARIGAILKDLGLA